MKLTIGAENPLEAVALSAGLLACPAILPVLSMGISSVLITMSGARTWSKPTLTEWVTTAGFQKVRTSKQQHSSKQQHYLCLRKNHGYGLASFKPRSSME